MQEVLTGIAEEEKKLEESHQNFRLYAGKLGLAVSHTDDGRIIIAPVMRQNVLDREAECAAVSNALEKREQVQTSFESDRKREAELQSKLRSTREMKEDLRSRLGAIAFEQCRGGVLSVEASEVLHELIDDYENLSYKAEKGNIVARVRFASLKKNFSEFCTRIFNTLKANGLEFSLSGERAAALIKEYGQCEAQERELVSLIAECQNRSMSSSDILSESESHEKISIRLKSLSDELNEAAISYGTYLFDNGAKWIDQHTPDSELDIISAMLEERKKQEECTLRINALKAQSQADDYRALIERNNQNISVLQHEIARLSHQIEEIENDNKVHMQRIRELEGRAR